MTTIDAEGRRRLLKLAAHLDVLPPEEFDMRVWGCMAAACALGTAATIPSFRKLGLRLRREAPTDPRDPRGTGEVSFGDNTNTFAAMAFFRINYLTASELFWPSSYGTPGSKIQPRQVAAHIRYMVAKAAR